MKININFKIDISVANIMDSVRLKYIWWQEERKWIKVHESAFCYMSKGWSRVKKKTSYYYNLCPKIYIAFFTSWLISNTFIILLNNIWKLAKNLKGYIYIHYILYVMFSREAGMILVILKRSTVMLLFCEVLWFFPFMTDLLYN